MRSIILPLLLTAIVPFIVGGCQDAPLPLDSGLPQDSLLPLDPDLSLLDPPGSRNDLGITDYVFTRGFWDNWRVDSQRNYTEVDGHGGMRRNAQGTLDIGEDRDGQGRFGFRVKFTEPDQINRAGGKHLGGVSSNELAFRPKVNGRRDPWETTRIDLDRPSNGRIRAHLYNMMDDGLYEQVHWFSAPLELDRWANVDMEWRQVGTRLTVTLNDQTHVFNLRPGSPPLGRYLYFGNMDSITGAIEFDDIYFEQ